MLIFSDSLSDQMGGEEMKKHKSNKIAEIATNYADLDIQSLERKLNESITEWIGNSKQLGDILLVGIKF